jgi:hypothetical protein
LNGCTRNVAFWRLCHNWTRIVLVNDEDRRDVEPIDARHDKELSSSAEGGPRSRPPRPSASGNDGHFLERVSDADRDHVVTLLRDHCAAGRLTLDEFSERVGSALTARTRVELDTVLGDLPTSSEAPPKATTRRARRWFVAVMGGSVARGRWRLGRHAIVLTVMGGCHLDLRQAEIEGLESTITAICVMGGVDIIAPEGINVELTGISIMGGRHIQLSDAPPLKGSPRIVVRAFPIMGGVNVRSRTFLSPGELRRDW